MRQTFDLRMARTTASQKSVVRQKRIDKKHNRGGSATNVSPGEQMKKRSPGESPGEQMEKRLKAICMTAYPTPGEGACMFYVIAYCMNPELRNKLHTSANGAAEMWTSEATAMRQLAVRAVVQYWNYFRDFFGVQEEGEPPMTQDGYVHIMSRLETHGTNLELTALVLSLKVDMYVVGLRGELDVHLIFADIFEGVNNRQVEEGSRLCIGLVHRIGGVDGDSHSNHYEPMFKGTLTEEDLLRCRSPAPAGSENTDASSESSDAAGSSGNPINI